MGELENYNELYGFYTKEYETICCPAACAREATIHKIHEYMKIK